MKRDKDGRPLDSDGYMAELLAAALAGMTYDELVEMRRQEAEKGH